MATGNESALGETLRNDRILFGSLLKHVVRAAPGEDPSDFVLASIGRNVGADRCYVYHFWEPGKSSMCTNTHEWCAEGIQPEIGGQQACDLSTLVEFNAHITSGRDFLFTDINDIDAGSREWLAPRGIQSLIATPLVGANGVVCGFAGFDFVKAPCAEFTDRIIVNIHEAADLLLNCKMLHERKPELQDISRWKDEYEENDREFERAFGTLQKDVRTMEPKQMLEIVRHRLDADICFVAQKFSAEGGGVILSEHALARDGWTNSQSWTIGPELCRALDSRFLASTFVTLHGKEIGWLKANIGNPASMSDFAERLQVVHSVGVRQEGRLVGVCCVGFVKDRQLNVPLANFLRRSAMLMVSSLERISTYHDLAVALNLAHLKGDIVDFMFLHQDYAEVRDYIGGKIREITGAQHLMLCSYDGSRSDWFGDDALPCCYDCVKKAVDLGRGLPADFFSEGESVIIPEGTVLPDMNLPRYCPMKSSVVSQFKSGSGWWRMIADYTESHKYNLDEVAGCLRMALELLATAYGREHHEKMISMLQDHLQFRADTLACALTKDDLPGLVDLVMHRLLDLCACDYIALHSVEGDHFILHPGGKLEKCPKRCESCSFYKLAIPPTADRDNIVEIDDVHGQTAAPIPDECPAKSLEVAVVYSGGKLWGGIALHYLKQQQVSREDRDTLVIAANVLSLALDRHHAAVRLEAERDKAVAAEKARSYFFSSVSHDIRSPLNVIIGFSEILQSGDVPPAEASKYLKLIVSNGKTLLQLVNDILDLSKLDVGKLEFKFEPTDIEALVRELEPVFQVSLEHKKQSLEVDMSGLPRLMIDPHRMRQLLFNFVSNAVKYAGPCTIRISVSYANGSLKLTVADNGRGVESEKAARLLEPFVQADIRNRAEGSGLGLAICKRLVEIVHGTIAVETAPGKGFVVRVTLPVEAAPVAASEATPPPPAAPAPGTPPRRVLLVDDYAANRMVMKLLLQRLGVADVELAEDGRAALDKLEGGGDFDLVLTDMWMPVMDGVELVKRIHADPRLAGVKVCLLTADVESRMTYRAQGFDAILLKPVTSDAIKDLFASLTVG